MNFVYLIAKILKYLTRRCIYIFHCSFIEFFCQNDSNIIQLRGTTILNGVTYYKSLHPRGSIIIVNNLKMLRSFKIKSTYNITPSSHSMFKQL